MIELAKPREITGLATRERVNSGIPTLFGRITRVAHLFTPGFTFVDAANTTHSRQCSRSFTLAYPASAPGQPINIDTHEAYIRVLVELHSARVLLVRATTRSLPRHQA